ncbi:4'-phosphopantetheinyl transferase [Streptomyces glaucosporus]|uniref:4'-phosphopantetheinyl transferase n=1 Tax=Streptomyces glaucosporus TaxID=284044 RepID=A0ABN3IBQ2_9ACTN
MIRPILPARVAVAETFADVPCRLLPEERAALGDVAEGRRREFATVRHCARRAMGGLGLPPLPLPPGAGGAPRWPDGVVGSMTHCRGYRAAAVARREDARAVGIDAEPHRPLREGVLERISLPGERERLAGLERSAEVCWDLLLFCAKEAVYKAWYPLTGVRLAFGDVEVLLAARTGTFRAHVVGDGARGVAGPVAFGGRWTVSGDLAAAAVVVPPEPSF